MKTLTFTAGDPQDLETVTIEFEVEYRDEGPASRGLLRVHSRFTCAYLDDVSVNELRALAGAFHDVLREVDEMGLGGEAGDVADETDMVADSMESTERSLVDGLTEAVARVSGTLQTIEEVQAQALERSAL